jgi:predicted small lipoprotein YifL
MKRVGAMLACLLLAACGQKGDLYMPDTARPVVVPANPAPATGDAATDQDDDDQPRQQQGAAGNAAGN